MDTGEHLLFREAVAEDRPAIRAILGEAFDSYGIDLPEDYSFADIEGLPHTYLRHGGAFQVLFRMERLIGFFGLAASDGRQVELKRLYLHVDERGKGLGNRLVRQAMQTAGEMGFARVLLETTSRFRQAVTLYRKFDFIDDPDAEPAPGHDIAMMKVL